MRLSRAIRMAMEDRGRSGRWLATRIGVQPRTVAAWLDGRSVPNYLQVLDIARELKVSEALFREEETPIPTRPPSPIAPYLLDVAESGIREGLRRVPRVRRQPQLSPGRPAPGNEAPHGQPRDRGT